VGVDILRVPEAFSLDGIEAKVRCVASAVGRVNEGDELIASLKQLPNGKSEARGIVTIGVNGGSPLVAGRNTSGDGLLRMAGVDNVVNHEGWKPLSREAMIELAPDFIVISERGVNMAGGLEKLMAHPSVRLTPAAENNRIIVMDGMAMLGFGPRTVTAARELRDSLASSRERGTGS
jgi:iron complex transport system substrate-binding protein